MRMNNGIIVVGAGFTGATAARVLAEYGYRVFLIEERGRVGGNAADTRLTHLYGPHIFHTNAQRIVDFLSEFTSWRPYEHRVRAQTRWGLVPMPVNFATLEALYGDQADDIVTRLCRAYGRGSSVPVLRLMGSEDELLAGIANELWATFFQGYTEKMWGMDPSLLSPGVTGRVPVRLSRDDRYFTDAFQAQPADGYQALFERMTDHPNIELHLNDRFEMSDYAAVGGRLIFTGPIDAFFDYELGALAYRSMRFTATTGGPRQMPYAATTNFPDPSLSYTRETEMGLLTGSGQSFMVRETPQPYTIGVNERYYPIPTPDARDRWHEYATKAEKRGIVLAGRLAEYKYLNMDQAVAAGLKAAEKITGVKL